MPSHAVKKSEKGMPDELLVKRARSVLARLRKSRPGPRIELEFTNPLELLVATILSAQCTDRRVNEVTRSLFRKYRTAAEYAAADLQTLQEEIRSTGFFRNKAKAIIAAAQNLMAEFGGEVPRSMEEMLTLPGVARKTANVVLGNAYGIPTGVVVDTHVERVARRLGLTREKQPEKIEQDLMRLYPPKGWIEASTQLVLHGRYVCTARDPACAECPVEKLCPKIGV
jgi:endonuclease-3